MRALKLGAASAVTVACGIASAMADGLPPRPADPYAYSPPVSLTYDWTGIYVGGHLGGANSRVEWTYDGTPAPFFGTPEAFEHSHTGLVAGGFAGLQKQWSWLVFGAEVGYLWMDQPESSSSRNVANTTAASNVRNLMLVTGKFGWAWENTFAYFKGGWASADVEFRTSTTSTGVLLTSSSGRENGWTAGAGIEYALWSHLVLGVEYDYVQMNASLAQTPSGGGPAGTHVSSGVDIQSLTARLSFKFGG